MKFKEVCVMLKGSYESNASGDNSCVNVLQVVDT
jgi:hypothetical protein